MMIIEQGQLSLLHFVRQHVVMRRPIHLTTSDDPKNIYMYVYIYQNNVLTYHRTTINRNLHKYIY